MMKANKQIGFIYKNEESIDKILKDGEVVFERGFLREKTSTTLPITFGGVGKDLKDYRVYGNTYQNTTSGKNLLDDKNITSRRNCTVNNGVITTTPLARANLVYVNINDIPLKAGDELYTTFKVRLKSGNASTISYGGRLYDGTTYATNTRLTDNHVSNEFIIYSVKQTVSTDIIANQMVFQAENAAGVSDAVYEIKDIIVSTNPIDTYEEYTGGQPSPNPDYPQEIISCGDRTKNLFDKNANMINGYIQSSTGKIISGHSDLIAYIKCKPNTQYSFQRVQIRDNKGRFRVGTTQTIPIADMTVENLYYDYSSEYSTTKLDGYVTNANAKYLLFYFSQISGMSQNEIDTILGSIQIEENPITTEYEPYYDGYKIPVNVRSENLLKVIANSSNGITSIINSDGSITYSGTATSTWANITASNYIDIEPGEYTFSIDKPLDYKIIIRLYYEDNTYDYAEIYATNTTRRFTLNKKVKRYYVYISNYLTVGKQYNETLYIQLIKGTTVPTKFQPYYNEITNIYLDEPLRKIGEYSDYIDFINGKVVRNIKEYTLIGDEQIKMIRGGMNCIKIDGKNIRTESLTMPPIFCNMLLANNRDSIYQGNVGIGYGAINNEYYNDIVMRVPNITTLTDFTTWLQSNNVIVDYVLSTPTEEAITLPNIPTIEGNNTLNIETEVTPSQVYIKYKSNN